MQGLQQPQADGKVREERPEGEQTSDPEQVARPSTAHSQVGKEEDQRGDRARVEAVDEPADEHGDHAQ